jgi:hypothetical protein
LACARKFARGAVAPSRCAPFLFVPQAPGELLTSKKSGPEFPARLVERGREEESERIEEIAYICQERKTASKLSGTANANAFMFADIVSSWPIWAVLPARSP